MLPQNQVDFILERLAKLRLSQEHFGLYIGVSVTLMSRYLRGLRSPPEGFFKEATAALEKLEKAENAATAARDRVLEGE